MPKARPVENSGISDLQMLVAIQKGSLWLKLNKLRAMGFIAGQVSTKLEVTEDGLKEIQRLVFMKPQVEPAPVKMLCHRASFVKAGHMWVPRTTATGAADRVAGKETSLMPDGQTAQERTEKTSEGTSRGFLG
jgi:hypothetical protein